MTQGSASPPPNPPQVLVVDDNVRVTNALCGIMRDAGYDPVPFNRGTDALDYARNTTPAAALVDIHLPDISGLILAQKLRERLGADRPIIIVSGDTSMETLNSLAHVGATYFLSKPISPALLLERLRSLLSPAA